MAWNGCASSTALICAGGHGRQLMPEFFRHQTTDVRVFLDIDSFQRDSGFRPDVVTSFYNHHEGHALPALFR